MIRLYGDEPPNNVIMQLLRVCELLLPFRCYNFSNNFNVCELYYCHLDVKMFLIILMYMYVSYYCHLDVKMFLIILMYVSYYCHLDVKMFLIMVNEIKKRIIQ